MPSSVFELVVQGGPDPRSFTAFVLDDSAARLAEYIFEWRYDSTALNLDLGELARAAIAGEPPKDNLHIQFGQRLFQAAFGGAVGELWQQRRKQARRQPLRLVVRVDPNSARSLLNLPWEYLHDGQGFLALDWHTPLSRLPYDVSPEPFEALDEALRLLVVIAAPSGLDENHILNYAREEEFILAATADARRASQLQVEFAPNGSMRALETLLSEYDPHILHVVAHGVFAPEQDCGFLQLEDEAGNEKLVSNPDFAGLLEQRARSLRLVFLSACQSAKVSQNNAASDLGPRLLAAGIPAVLAMQYSVFNRAAIEFGGAFYKGLGQGNPLDEALSEARPILQRGSPNGVDFATPALYLADPGCLRIDPAALRRKAESDIPRDLSGLSLVSHFVGRSAELRELQTRLDPETGTWRAAVIHGLGGMGKTVLAARLAERMGRRLAGVKSIRLTPTTTAQNILDQIAEFLLVNNARFNLAAISQFQQAKDQSLALETKAGLLAEMLKRLPLLIVFDNCEDVLPQGDPVSRARQAPALSAQDPDLLKLIAILVGGVPGPSRFLFTSRIDFDLLEPGRLVAEIGHLDLGEMRFREAVYLMETLPPLADLPVVTEPEGTGAGISKRALYQKLGGHPYTLGLFAQHAERSSVAGVLADLGEVRRELLEFTLLERALAKLSERTRLVLRRGAIYNEPVPEGGLAYLVGDEHDCMPEIGPEVAELLKWGLIAQPPGTESYALHSLVKEWARGQIEAGERHELLRRAADYWLGVGRESTSLNPELNAWNYLSEAGEFERAYGVLEGITEYLLRFGQIELLFNLLRTSIATPLKGRPLASTLHNLGIVYQRLGEYREAHQYYEQSLAIDEDMGHQRGAARNLHQLGILHQKQGEYGQARQRYEQSLAMAEKLGDQLGAAISLHHLGMLDYQQGEYPQARQRYEQSLMISKELGDWSGVASSLHQLGMLYQDQGEYPHARQCYEQSLSTFQELGDQSGVAGCLHQLGTLHYRQGEYPQALQCYKQSLVIAEELGDRSGVAINLGQLGLLHYLQREYLQARQRYERSLAIFQELGERSGIAGSLHQLGLLYQKQGEYREAYQCYEQSLAILHELGDRLGASRILHELGRLHQSQDEYREARQCYEQSLAIKQELGNQLGVATSLHQLGRLCEQEELLPEAVGYLAQALALFLSLGAPEQKLTQQVLTRLKEKMGSDAFEKALAEAGVPDFESESSPNQGRMTVAQVLEVITRNTIAVMTAVPGKKSEWWQGLGQLQPQFKSQGLDELALFVDLCRRLVEGVKPADLTPQVPPALQAAWQAILDGISGKSEKE